MRIKCILLLIQLYLISESFSMTLTSLPFSSTSSFKGLFIRKFSTSEIYIGNGNEEMRYNFLTNSRVQSFSYKSLCYAGTKCPFLVSNGSTYTHVVSGSDGKIRFMSLSSDSYKETKIDANDFRSAGQYDSSIVFIMGAESLSASKGFGRFNVNTGSKEAYNTKWYTNDGEFIVLGDKQLVFVQYYSGSSDAIFYNYDLEKTKTIDITSIGESIGYYKSIEFADKKLISCFLVDDRDQVKCFSSTYGTQSFSIQYGPKTILSSCSLNNEVSFSLYKLDESTAILGCGGPSIKITKFNYQLNTIDSTITLSGYSFIDYTVINEITLIFTYAKQENNVYNYYSSIYYFPFCVDQTIYPISTISYNLSNIFSYNDFTSHTNQIMILSSPTNGKIYSNSQSISLNKIYSITGMTFQISSSISDSFTYKGVESSTFNSATFYSAQCKLTIITCYETCSSCSQIGTSSKHNCNRCANDRGYYRLDDQNGNCITEKDKPSNYYLDTSSSLPEKTFKPCYSSCSTCSIGGDSNKHNCNLCIDSYVFTSSNPSNCVPLSPKPDGLYLGRNEEGNLEYYPCETSNCKDCVGPHDDDKSEYQCLTCMSSYSFYESQEGLCVETASIPSNTYYDEVNEIYQNCHQRCNLCSIGGNDTTNNCIECKDELHFITETNCISEKEKEESYIDFYLNEDNNTYLHCGENCATCHQAPSETDNNCDSCISGYSYLFSIPATSNCIDISLKPSNYYLDKETNTMKQCYSSCSTCSFGGSSSNNNCTQCIDNYFFVENTANCIKKGTAESNYYFDSNDNTYKKCYQRCATCSMGGSESINNCLQCEEDFYKKENDDTNSCYAISEKEENEYLDNNNIIRKCNSACSSCDKGSNDTNTNCLMCIENYYFISEANCISINNKPSDYYIEGDQMKKCVDSCATCETGFNVDSGEYNCKTCKEGYFFLNESSTICINSIVDGFYLDKDVLKPCFSSCALCSSGGDSLHNNCDKCKNDFHWISDKEKNCVYQDNKPENYYLDDKDDTYKQCHKFCKKCSIGGTDEKNNCDECINSYYFISSNPTQCIYEEDKPSNYYKDGDTFKECHSTCATCDKGYNEELKRQNCNKCIDGYWFENENSTNCINYIIDGMYLDKDVLKKCYDTCQTCNYGGTEKDNNCTLCKDKFFFVENIKNCIDNTEMPSNFYFDKDSQTYKQCHPQCKTCTQGGDETNNNCNSCIDSYYFLDGDSVSSCYSKPPADNYYIKGDHYYKCYSSCSTCDKAGDEKKQNCLSCNSNLFFIENYPTNCVTLEEKPTNYYFDEESQSYKKCYPSCGSCSKGGNDTNHNCNTCASEEYSFVSTTKGNCILTSEKPSNYYFDKEDNTVKPCYYSCSKCTKGGTSSKHNCDECANHYSFIIDQISNCIKNGDQPSNYFLNKDNNTYLQCYSKCATCSSLGDDEINHCNTCINNLEFTTGNTLGNCKFLPEVNDDISEVHQFLPVYKSLSSDYEVKILQISNNTLLYYYSTNTIFTSSISNFTYVDLGDCKETLQSLYSLSSKEELLLVSVLYQNDVTKVDFDIYSKNGTYLDKNKCLGKEITLYYPLIRNNSNTSLALSLLDKTYRKSNEKIDLYNTSSEFYTDPCIAVNVNDEQISLSERQEMYVYDLTQCPSTCQYTEYSEEKKVIKCKCEMISTFQTIDANSNNSDSIVFENLNINDYSHYLFKCGTAFKSFPAFTSYVHWFSFASIGTSIAMLVLFIKNISKLSKALLKASPTKPSETSIEMTDIKSTSKKTTLVEQKNENIDKMKDNRGPYQFVSDTLKDKLFIISLFTYRNVLYPLFSKLSLNIFIVSTLFFFNSFFYKDDSSMILCILIASLIAYFIFKILDNVLSVYSEEKKEIMKAVKIRNIIIYSLCLMFNCVYWYYLFVFGVVKRGKQVTIIGYSMISIIIIIALQIILTVINSIIRMIARISKSNCLYTFCKVVYYCI